MPVRTKQQPTRSKVSKPQQTTTAAHEVPSKSAGQPADVAQEIRRIAKNAPGRLRVDLVGNELTIRRSMRNPQGYRQLWVNLAGLLLLAFFGVQIWSSSSAAADSATKVMGLATAALSLIPIIYYCLIVIFDEEIIRVNAAGVQLFYRPLPFPGKRISSQEIAQLYTVSYEREQLTSLQDKHKKYETVYGVRLRTERGKDIPLAGGIATQKEATFVEQVIERSLGIRDSFPSSEAADV